MRITISRGRANRRGLFLGATAIIAILGLTSCSADVISSAQNNTDAPEAEASAVLEPFDPNAPAGEGPTDLPNRLGAVLPAADAQYQSIDSALRAGAEAAGLDYVSAFSDGNQDDMLSKGQTILDQGVAGLYSFAINRESEEPLMNALIDAGGASFNVAGYPSTVQINGSQAAAGTKQATAAIEWIEENIGAENARVVYLNNATTENLIPRDDAVRAAFEEAGIEIIADETPTDTTPDAGYTLMSTVVQRYPDVNVVLGGYSVTGGAVSALEAAGRTGDDIYASVGNPSDAELEMIAKGSILRAGLIFPFDPMAYVIGQYTADWIAGKSIPAAITIPGGNFLLDGAEGVAQYKADMEDLPGLVESGRISEYVGLWGNTRYEDRAERTWTTSWQQADV